MKDLKETFEPKIRALVKVPLSQNEYDAIYSFAFNIGVGRGFPSSEFLKELNKGHYDGTLMLHWRRPSEIIGRRKKRLNCLIMEYTRNENENVNFNWLHHRKLYIST